MPYRAAPAPPPKIPDGPDHIGAAQRRARRNRRIGLILTVALAAAGAASLMVHRAHRARHRAAFDRAKLDLEACLLGPQPIAGSARGAATCSVRIRRRQLVAMATPVERRIDEALGGWPMRCSEATRRMTREGIELEDLELQREGDEGTRALATMKALSGALAITLCSDASGGALPPHLATSGVVSLPALAAPLDLDALIAHGPPAHKARSANELEDGLVALLPEGTRNVGSMSVDQPPKLPDGESMFTDRDWPGVIHIAKCQGAQCQKRIVARETFDLNDPDLRASAADRFQAAWVGRSVLAVWRAGARGGLRMRVAPIDGLTSARDVVVFDDLVRDGAMQTTPTLEAFRIYGGTRQARIFLVTREGTWLVDVDEQGSFALR